MHRRRQSQIPIKYVTYTGTKRLQVSIYQFKWRHDLSVFFFSILNRSMQCGIGSDLSLIRIFVARVCLRQAQIYKLNLV